MNNSNKCLLKLYVTYFHNLEKNDYYHKIKKEDSFPSLITR